MNLIPLYNCKILTQKGTWAKILTKDNKTLEVNRKVVYIYSTEELKGLVEFLTMMQSGKLNIAV